MNKPLLTSDPWIELLRGSVPLLRRDEGQPPQHLQEYLLQMKRFWSEAVLGSKTEPLKKACIPLLKSPFAKEHPLARVLSYLLAKEIQFPTPPLVSLHPLMPLDVSCQLALLLAIAGEEGVQSFASKLLPLTFFPSLWCKEEDFCEQQAQFSISLLRRAFGIYDPLPPSAIPRGIEKSGIGPGGSSDFLTGARDIARGKDRSEGEKSEAKPTQALGPPSMGKAQLQNRFFNHERYIDPFFLALASRSPQWELDSFPLTRVADPEFGLLFQKTEEARSVVTLAGEKTSLGAFSAGGIEVRAFGPHMLPLNDARGFGVLRLPDSLPMERWTAIAHFPEAWMEVSSQLEKGEFRLSLRFLGLKVDKPIAFVFYVKAPHCEVEGEKLQPKSLQRIQGEAKPVLFGGEVEIASALPAKMEVIPLAGEGYFWNCEYLVAFEINSFEARGEYVISLKKVVL